MRTITKVTTVTAVVLTAGALVAMPTLAAGQPSGRATARVRARPPPTATARDAGKVTARDPAAEWESGFAGPVPAQATACSSHRAAP